eukprot:gene27693-7335_t
MLVRASSSTEERLVVSIRQGSSPDELRAASYLRAVSFYTYPSDRSEFSARAHRRMKTDTEFESLGNKLEGTDESFKNIKVLCFVATAPAGPNLQQDAEAPTTLPPVGDAPSEMVVGTLDLNVGSVLPSEELIAESARKQGVAQKLIKAAEERAAALGVSNLYVHVVHSNTPAVNLYQSSTLGFKVEAEESESTAKALQRPRRLILTKPI